MDERLKELLRQLQGSTVQRELSVVTAGAIDEANRKISFIAISDDNAGKRWDWDRGVYTEILDVNGANYERLRVFLKDHNNSTDSAVGRIENKRVEDNQFKIDVVFGTDEESEKIFRKYCEGILTDCSVRYIINKVQVEERNGEPDIVTVTDFDIFECSAVGVGFDKGAMVGRNLEIQGEKPMDEKLRKELEGLRSAVDGLTDEQKKRKVELENLEKEFKRATNVENTNTDAVPGATANTNAEQQRSSEIMGLVVSGQITSERALEHINAGDSVDAVYRAIVNERVNDSKPVVVIGGRPDEGNLRSAIENAMMSRVGISISTEQTNDLTKRFMGASLHEMAREYLGLNTYDKNEIAERAMSTSDFPVLLGNIGRKVMADTFEETESTYQLWTKAEDVPDFKEQNEITLNSGGRLKKLKEKSEKKNSEFSETVEKWKVQSFGDEFVFTREMIINDDLNAFVNMLQIFSQKARRTSNGEVYDMLQALNDYVSFAMSDGKAIFHTDHKNLAASGTALSSTSLTAGRTAMRRQTGVDGKALNINPKFLIVSPENETIAKQLLGSEADVGSNNSGIKNPHQNVYDLIVDAELAAAPWYLAAMNQIKVGYLSGTGRKPIVKATEMGLSATKFECVYDFGVGAMNYRGLYRNAGV